MHLAVTGTAAMGAVVVAAVFLAAAWVVADDDGVVVADDIADRDVNGAVLVPLSGLSLVQYLLDFFGYFVGHESPASRYR